jgi:hypothetical protein
MGGILELIKLIYGSKALSKVLGTRTNVIRLPDNELKQYTKSDLNIEAASDKLAQKAKADMKELLADYPRMNDAEKLIFEGNLRRLGNKLGVTQKKQGSAADVLEFGTGEKVSPEGIMSLTEKAGQKNPPTTLMGKLESRIKQLEASGEDLSKMKGQTYDEFMNDITQGQRTMIRLEDEGLVRATAREIIDKDIKSKKIKLPKEIEADFKQGGGEPIDVFRQFYGEDALEQLNSMVPDFRQMYSSKEAAEAAIKKFKFKFKADRPPGSISIEDAKKAEQEFNIIPADSEEGKIITEKLIGKPKAPVTELVTAEKIILDMKNMDPMDAMKEANKVLKREGKYKNLKEEDVERIMEDTNDFIFGRDIPEDPEGFAKGGRVGMAGGGILKLAMKFFNDNNPVSAYKKYLKYVKETAQKDPAKLAPEMGGIVVGSELIHRGLRRKLKEAKEKNDTDDSEDTTTEDRTEKAGGGVSQGLDYLMGIERRGYQEGSVSQEGVIPGFTRLINPDGAPGNYNEFMYEGPDGQIYGAGTYSSIAAGQYPNIYDPSKNTTVIEQTTPTAGLYQTTNPNALGYAGDPTIRPLRPMSPTAVDSSAPASTSVAEKLFPQGDFLNIKETAASPTEYNIEATKDLVENLPSILQPLAPAAAAALSLPYDAIQAYQRMEPDSGIAGFRKAFQAERPLKSAFERFIGASGPLAENINTAVSSLNPYQQQRYMNYALENPDRAIQAAQRDQDFRTAIERRSGSTTPLIEEGTGRRIGIPLPFDRSGPTTPLMNEGPKAIGGGFSFTSPQNEKIIFNSLTGFRTPDGRSYDGPIPENIKNISRAIAANGGRMGPSEEEGTGGRIGIPLPFDRSGPIKPLMATGGRVRYANGSGLDYLLGM